MLVKGRVWGTMLGQGKGVGDSGEQETVGDNTGEGEGVGSRGGERTVLLTVTMS